MRWCICSARQCTVCRQKKPGLSSASVVVDVQNCFLPGGSLAVKDGDQVIPVINRIAKEFENVVMTQDWHTAHHISFASSHEGKKPFEVIKLAYGNQVLWPDHCVQGSEGASIAKDINIPKRHRLSAKVTTTMSTATRPSSRPKRDPHRSCRATWKSAKIDHDLRHRPRPPISAWPGRRDARNAGLNVYVVEDACRGIDINGSVAKAWEDMTEARRQEDLVERHRLDRSWAAAAKRNRARHEAIAMKNLPLAKYYQAAGRETARRW